MLTYEIMLRVEDMDDDEEKKAVLTAACQEKARELYAIASLLKSKRDPQIVFQSGDMFQRNKDLEILSEADL